MSRKQIVKNPRNEADVRLLLDVFPDLLPDGRVITHEQLEAVLKMPRLGGRYKTVVTKWRRILFTEKRVYLDGRVAEGQGFVCLTPNEMVRFGNREVRSAGRKVKKAIAVSAAPNDEELSEEMRRYRSLLQAAAIKIAHEHKQTLREVSKAMAPMKQLPRASAG